MFLFYDRFGLSLEYMEESIKNSFSGDEYEKSLDECVEQLYDLLKLNSKLPTHLNANFKLSPLRGFTD